MASEHISFKKTGYFSELICDYLEQADSLKPFYNRFPSLEGFKNQIDEKANEYLDVNRKVLVNVLAEQYSNLDPSEKTLQNIEALKSQNTFTITTGHQLNLFTGPLYFLYKIVSTINLTVELKEKFPDYNFVPIYWMATEDHDFDEINYFNFKGRKIHWARDSNGAVGELNTIGLKDVFKDFSQLLGLGENANNLRRFFETAYVNHDNLADATRYLANALFENYGLVILEANDSKLKRLFIPCLENELINQSAFNLINETSKQLEGLKESYKAQVNPREINLFYLTEGLRERIVFEGGNYAVLNSNMSFSKDELLNHLHEHPERFSPNVVMRPLYQEVILPNLCYIGGGGELAYWLQLKANFENSKVTFPMLLLRNSVLIKSNKQFEKQQKTELTNDDLFLKQKDLILKKTKDLSSIKIDFSSQKNHLKKQFEELYDLAKKTDKSFIGAVAAQERKQIKGLEHLEKRLLRAEKRNLKEQLTKISQLQNTLFPNQSLQERHVNFSELYLEYGEQLIPFLIETLNPLQGDFSVLTI